MKRGRVQSGNTQCEEAVCVWGGCPCVTLTIEMGGASHVGSTKIQEIHREGSTESLFRRTGA